jgi:hypothetical protein
VKLLEPRHPNHLDAPHAMIVQDLIGLAEAGNQDALNAIIAMLEDLREHGLESRFIKNLKGTPVWELKTRARGGQKGGARVYWFPLQIKQEPDHTETFAVIVNAEVKTGDTPNPNKLKEALEIYLAFKRDAPTMLRRSS